MKLIRTAGTFALGWQVATASGADLAQTLNPAVRASPVVLEGRASVINGDTLWFPQFAKKVRLAGIEACALPQWAFDPSLKTGQQALAPVPCGPFGKAWLKRAVGMSDVSCRDTVPDGGMMEGLAYCSVRGRDLGYEMLRVGLARVRPGGATTIRYLEAERYARSARYGLWGTYVLDPTEWQTKAIDRTLQRQPHADGNLLRERSAEISPPFEDLRNRPRRTDR